jgi:hypothetical protein
MTTDGYRNSSGLDCQGGGCIRLWAIPGRSPDERLRNPGTPSPTPDVALMRSSGLRTPGTDAVFAPRVGAMTDARAIRRSGVFRGGKSTPRRLSGVKDESNDGNRPGARA